MTEELYINNQRVDLKPDTRITLNFKSNMLGDISKITSSNSQTINLPKTSRNRMILDNPTAVACISDSRYQRHSARYVRDGVEVVRVAYAVLLDSSDDYEIAVYWGVMSAFQSWIDKGLKLTDLLGEEYLLWNNLTTPTNLNQMIAAGYGYAAYDCGVSDKSLTNIHPSATAWWVLEKIAAQAGFTFEIPEQYKQTLQRMAVPCLARNASPESWEEEKTSVSVGCKTIQEYKSLYEVGVFQKKSVEQRRDVYVGDKVGRTYYIPNGGGNYVETVYMAEFSTLSLATMNIYIDARAVNTTQYTIICMCVRKEGESFHRYDPPTFKSWNISEQREIREEIDCSDFDFYFFILKNPVQESKTYTIDINIAPHVDDMIYPSAFRIIPNLPEITQIDFVKAICGMLGIFVMPDIKDTNKIRFVSLDVLYQNKAKAYDWSDKIISSNDDEPKTVKFKFGEYCRNNYFKYKEDDTVTASGDGNMTVRSETIDREKTVLTLPFAASDGNKIPHYKLSDDGKEAQPVNVKDRIMRLVDNGDRASALTFQDLSVEQLIPQYYETLQRMLNEAIVINDAFRLTEYDLKTIDYTVPFYLRQYGRYYGVISIQTASDGTCNVAAIQLSIN